MSMNATPSGERLHIGFFGRRNAGKSSVVNAVTGQALSVVSDVKGTTTDPVQKAMELLPLGPVLIIDTPGFDDTGALGALRVQKTRQILNKTDIAVLVVDATVGKTPADDELIRLFTDKNIPWLLACNKADLITPPTSAAENQLYISAKTGAGIRQLKEQLAGLSRPDQPQRRIVGDLLSPGDAVVLVTPIDSAAPKGRLILPQQQTIRDILDADAIAVVTKEFQLRDALARLTRPPRMVITDSQAFEKVNAEVPPEIPLTSFSILFARYKGTLTGAVRGAYALDKIQNGDQILISEGCTHHRQCDDIGSVKLPRWITNYTKAQPDFHFSSGGEFPTDLSPYKLVVHCGGCMLPPREMQYRAACAADAGVPMTNYGILIAYMQGILQRSIALFPDLQQ